MKRPLLHALAIILSCFHYGSCGWLLSSQKCGSLVALRGGGSINNNDHDAPTCEVVGASGRMGSLWLKQQKGSVAVSRGISPGCLSPQERPIYVATPSKAWRQIYNETIPSRRNDLVWIGNGLLLPKMMNSTVVVPHYGILQVGAPPITSKDSPATVIYGKHAKQVETVLRRQGISTQIVSSWNNVQIHAAQKLLWASCMWLLCHLSPDAPLTVEQVHDERQELLVDLVKELLPVLQDLVADTTMIELNDTLKYLEAYSRSMPGAIPSKELATSEVKERNGVWLAKSHCFPQPIHEELLVKVAGKDTLKRLKEEILLSDSSERYCVELEHVGLKVWGVKDSSERRRNNIIVIGAGIVGSSVALNLARQGMNVTVIDALPEPELGATTPASWAWINANNKFPPAYQWLNQLGMITWRKEPVVSKFPIWNGALVQYKEEPLLLGGYSAEGPLSKQRILELEPNANFSFSDGPVYYFAGEGLVDPATAVHSMHQTAKAMGVRFLSGHNVTSVMRDANGHVVGVESQSTSTSSDMIMTPATVVVVAAGIGSSSPALGGLPLTHSPGQIAFATPSSSSPQPLQRILVDTIRESHVLQRSNGAIVAGGGFLEVGGTPSASLERDDQQNVDNDRSIAEKLLAVASQLAPKPVATSKYSHTATAIRPIPRDGLPAIGYIEPGLYTTVTHSGVTLAPFVGMLVATEIAHGLELDILDPFRPTRLFGRVDQ